MARAGSVQGKAPRGTAHGTTAEGPARADRSSQIRIGEHGVSTASHASGSHRATCRTSRCVRSKARCSGESAFCQPQVPDQGSDVSSSIVSPNVRPSMTTPGPPEILRGFEAKMACASRDMPRTPASLSVATTGSGWGMDVSMRVGPSTRPRISHEKTRPHHPEAQENTVIVGVELVVPVLVGNGTGEVSDGSQPVITTAMARKRATAGILLFMNPMMRRPSRLFKMASVPGWTLATA